MQLDKVCLIHNDNSIEMIEEGEEGYYTNMVHLMYNVFGKQMEWIVCFSSRRFDNNTIHKNT